MSLADYNGLKAAVASWLQRSDLTDNIPDLVALGEARINRTLRLLQMEATANVSLADGDDAADLPTGFLDIISLTYSDTRETLTQIAPAERERLYATSQGRPQLFAISDGFLFECPAGAAYTLPCRYYKKWDLAGDDTNWLMTNSPGAYLYAALAEAAPFLMDDERVGLWEGKLAALIADLNALDARVRSRAPLRVDDGLLGRPYGAMDITRGY